MLVSLIFSCHVGMRFEIRIASAMAFRLTVKGAFDLTFIGIVYCFDGTAQWVTVWISELHTHRVDSQKSYIIFFVCPSGSCTFCKLYQRCKRNPCAAMSSNSKTYIIVCSL